MKAVSVITNVVAVVARGESLHVRPDEQCGSIALEEMPQRALPDRSYRIKNALRRKIALRFRKAAAM
jgi:hypothetical protein